MTETIKKYNSVKEIAQTIDVELSETKSKLGEYLRQLDDIRTLAERSQRVREVVLKLAGKKNGSTESLDEIEVGSIKLVLDANPFHEMAAIESAVRSHQERILTLQKAHDGLKSLDQLGETDGLNLMVLENQGIPDRILLMTT